MKTGNRYFVMPSIIIAGLLLFMGCATFPKEQEKAPNSALSVGRVKTEITKGTTTQAEILEIFGSPNIVTKNRDNDEVWNYNRMSYQSVYGSDGGGIIFWGGSRAMASQSTKSFDLIIIFDEKDIVKDYSIVSASF